MIYKKFQDLQLSTLGMGAMRLPTIDGDDGKIDTSATEEIVAYAMEQGVNYYDTAWGYHNGNSELVMGAALKKYPRDKFYLATKFPGYDLANMPKVKEIFEKQLEKCQEIYDFLSKKEYAECMERNSHALYLLLRVAWMCYNRRPLSDRGQERRMTRLDRGQWEDIRRICCLYEACTNSNRRPIVVLIHALSVVQLAGDYREAADMLVNLNEEAFYATPRMRVPYMICTSDGAPAAYAGKVIDAKERFKGFIKVDGLPLYLGNKKGVRFFLNNLGNRKMPEENEYLPGLEMGIGYMGFSLYTAEGRKRLEGRP